LLKSALYLYISGLNKFAGHFRQKERRKVTRRHVIAAIPAFLKV